MGIGIEFMDVVLEDTGRIVHRSADETREGEHGRMVGRRASESLVFGTLRGLVTDEVGPCAA